MGVEKVMDPGFREGVAGYVSEAGKKATEVGKSANEWGKAQLGVDVAGQVGGLVGSISGSGPGGRGNYTAVGDPHGHGMDDEEEGTSALYQAGGHDDFFTEWDGQARGNQNKTSATAPKQGGNKKEDWGKEDDEWKDF
jgi:ADP-ribosylation factor GTPase-activating protein 1